MDKEQFENFMNERPFPIKEALKDWWATYYDEGFDFSEIQSWEATSPSEKGSDVPVISVMVKMRNKTFHREFYPIDFEVYSL